MTWPLVVALRDWVMLVSGLAFIALLLWHSLRHAWREYRAWMSGLADNKSDE